MTELKRILLIGPADSGHELIAQQIEERKTLLPKVASIVYYPKTIIAPASYLESPWMHKHLISLQQAASEVWFLQGVMSRKISYPPQFAKAFRIPVKGMLTFWPPYFEEQVLLAEKRLLISGLTKTTAKIDLSQIAIFDWKNIAKGGEEDD